MKRVGSERGAAVASSVLGQAAILLRITPLDADQFSDNTLRIKYLYATRHLNKGERGEPLLPHRRITAQKRIASLGPRFVFH